MNYRHLAWFSLIIQQEEMSSCPSLCSGLVFTCGSFCCCRIPKLYLAGHRISAQTPSQFYAFPWRNRSASQANWQRIDRPPFGTQHGTKQRPFQRRRLRTVVRVARGVCETGPHQHRPRQGPGRRPVQFVSDHFFRRRQSSQEVSEGETTARLVWFLWKLASESSRYGACVWNAIA